MSEQDRTTMEQHPRAEHRAEDLTNDRRPRQVLALDEIHGFRVRPGLYDMNGATVLTDGVNFTVYSNGATHITLVLYHRGDRKPYAEIPFPESYRIGKVFSMIVFGLD
ncbi:MAG: glycogen debranching enzyme, partial [Lachnospiraceae bacterium]|nr:glycogen debranching enzyme [Lachnospiraceae bacterium]